MADINIDTSETVDENEITEEDLVNGIEPGELPSANESGGDKVVNVLEDILGADGGQDDLQKELDDSAIKKDGTPKIKKAAKAKGSKAKATPKRKSSRKSKGSAKKTETAVLTESNNTPIVEPEIKPNEETESVTKIKSVKIDATEKKSDKNSDAKNDTNAKIEVKAEKAVKNKDKSVPNTTSSKSTEKNETTPKPVRVSKKNKKESGEKESKKESKKLEVKKEEIKAAHSEEVALEKKVKELEKMVKPMPIVTETEKTVKVKKEKTQSSKNSDRKRKASENSTKDGKTKKTKEIKSKAEKVEKKEDIANISEYDIKLEPMSENEDAMRVIDEMHAEQSDHGSNFSHASSFSHTFSHSASFSGSFTGSLSGSISLSSFTGSNTSLDFIDKEVGKKKKKKIKHIEEEEANEEAIQEHKEFIDSLLKGARYFIVKSNNHENVTLSKAKGVWATPPANERKLNDAYRHSTNVILVYSVKESGRFQGFARLASESRHDGIPIPWVLPPGFDRRILGGTFKVDWLNRKDVPFSDCANLRNPWNENKEVKICRDGQELEPSVGEVLCRMFEEDMTIDLSRVARHLKQRKRLGDYFQKRDRYPRFRGGYRGTWRGGRVDFRGGFRGDRGRFGGRRAGYFRRDAPGFRGRFDHDHGRGRHQNKYERYERGQSPHERMEFSRSRSRSPAEYRRGDRESRERKHKDKVKEFLKNDRSKFGVRKETLLHGSYSDYVREFQRQKQIRSSSSYYHPQSSSYHHMSDRHRSYEDPKFAAEEFLRRSRR